MDNNGINQNKSHWGFGSYMQLRHYAETLDRLLKYNELLEFSRVLLGFTF